MLADILVGVAAVIGAAILLLVGVGMVVAACDAQFERARARAKLNDWVKRRGGK